MATVDGLRSIVQKPGFIHTLCIIIANETLFHSAEALSSRNRFELISHHEIAVIISLLSEARIDLTTPSHDEIEAQYIQCKHELDVLHGAISALSRSANIADFFTDGSHFVEPIFYAPSSAFWFDYLDIAPQVYELDRQFLIDRGYDISSFATLLGEMHDLFRNRIRHFIRAQRKKVRKGQLVQSPLECFLFSPADFSPEHANSFSLFAERFSARPGENPTVKDPMSYHPAKARPALRLSDNRMFVPLVPILCERLFENPFYVVVSDAAYFATNANNRGIAAERTAHRLLQTIKGLNLLTDVQLHRGRDAIDQIDIVAAFGATAILFEVKTKRLTEASKQGDTAKLIQDVRQGIIDAKQQLEFQQIPPAIQAL